MDAYDPITAAAISAYLKCPTKAHLLVIGEAAPATFFADIEARISSMYKAAAKRWLGVGTGAAELLDFARIWTSLDYDASTHRIDCETAVYDFAAQSHRPGGGQPQESSPSGTLEPVLFSPWDKPELSDSLLLCFGALALSQATGIVADSGRLIYGEGHRSRTVRIGDHVARTRQIIDAIGTSCRKPHPLVLNKHCAVWDFQTRCRDLAIENDDLSLLGAMTVKERAKCNAKGIFSITQLSYGYRPRRRKRRPDAARSKDSGKRSALMVRNDHKLKGPRDQEKPDSRRRSPVTKIRRYPNLPGR
jgi:hypothetical protein